MDGGEDYADFTTETRRPKICQLEYVLKFFHNLQYTISEISILFKWTLVSTR